MSKAQAVIYARFSPRPSPQECDSVDLDDALAEQEQPTEQQHQVPCRERLTREVQPRLRQVGEPYD